jgi:hypothetical protein
MTEQEQDDQKVTSEYLEAVAVARGETRKVWGDDDGKSPGFLLTVVASEIGRTADAILGNPYGDDPLSNCEAAIDQVVMVGAACSSLFELLVRNRARLVEEFAGEHSAR